MKGPYLEVQANGQRTEVLLDRPRIAIGRHAANEIVVNDTRASRSHCVVELLEDGGFQVRDLQSANGTRVNGGPVSAVILSPGDIISIGQVTLTYLVDNEADPEWLTEDDVVYDEQVPGRERVRRAWWNHPDRAGVGL